MKRLAGFTVLMWAVVAGVAIATRSWLWLPFRSASGPARDAMTQAVTDQFDGKYASAWYPIVAASASRTEVAMAMVGFVALGVALTLTGLLIIRFVRARRRPDVEPRLAS